MLQARSTIYVDPSNRRVVLALLAILTCGAALLAIGLRRASTTTVDTRVQTGVHLTVTVVAPTINIDQELRRVVDSARSVLRTQASRLGYLFSTVGVSDDWNVRRGLQSLRDLGPFDEVVVGRNWLNSGIKRYVDVGGNAAAVPQIVVSIQHVRTDTLPFQYGEMTTVRRLIGGTAIRQWRAAGFALPTLSANGRTQ